MLGVVAGDIIASPYQWTDAPDRYFTLGESTRFYRGGREVNAHPRFTDGTVLSLAVARWLMQDENHSSSSLARIIRDLGRDYPTCGFSPRMQRFIESDYPRPFTSDESAVAMMAVPVGLRAGSLPEAITLARQVASVVSAGEATSKASEVVAQVVWMARHSREKDDIRFTIEKDFGYDLSISEEDLKAMLSGAVKEPIIVNGVETGDFYYRLPDRPRQDFSPEAAISASMRAFLDSDGFEDAVRRATALGGDSCTIAAIAGAVAEPYYGGVPEKISGLCERYLDKNLKTVMDMFETIDLRKGRSDGKLEKRSDDSLRIIKCGDQRVFVVDSYRKDLISAIRDKFGADAEIIPPRAASARLEELSQQPMDGTYLERPRPDVRTIYFQDGEFRTSATVEGKGLASKEARMSSRQDFCEIKAHAEFVKRTLQDAVGYGYDGSIHFANAYYPVIFHDRVEIWKGDAFAGSVGIDPVSGLLKINAGGDFGPMEWFQERTESVFNSVSVDSIKEAIGRYCLDEGIGIFDKNRTSNLQTANNDVAHSKDSRLQELVNSKSTRIPTGVKR